MREKIIIFKSVVLFVLTAVIFLAACSANDNLTELLIDKVDYTTDDYKYEENSENTYIIDVSPFDAANICESQSGIVSGDSKNTEEYTILYRYERAGLAGYIDTYGNVIIEPQFYWAHPFSEGLAFVKGVEGREGQTGFIDMSGEMVIPLPNAIEAHRFSEGFAAIIEREWGRDEEPLAVSTPGPFIFIDRTGENIFGREFGSVAPFSDGFARVTIPNGGWGFIDRTGQNAFGQEFRGARDFVDGLAIVTLMNRNVAVIDTTGNNAFGIEFVDVQDFEGDYAKVTLLDGTRTYVDRQGNIADRR